MALIAQRGIDHVRVADIGRQVGMSPGHVLYYFGTKGGILLETLRWSESELGERRATMLALSRAGWPKLQRFVDVYLPEAPSDPRWKLWLEVWGRAKSGELAESLRELEDGWRGDVAGVVAEGAEAGLFRTVDAEDFALRFVALLDGLSILVLEGTRDRRDMLATAVHAARIELAP